MRETKMVKTNVVRLAAMSVALSAGTAMAAAITGWQPTVAGTYVYTDSANWVGGTVNGVWDQSLLLTASQTVTFTDNLSLGTGLTFNYDGGFNEALIGSGADRTITLGGDIAVNTVSTTRTITLGSTTANAGLNVDLGGATRTLTVGSGRALGFVNTISNGGLTLYGGTVNFSGNNSYAGATNVYSGALSLNGANGNAANSDIAIYANGANTTSLTFKSDAGSGITRAKSVALNGTGGSQGSVLSVSGNATNDTADSITNALTISAGFSYVTLTPNASQNLRLNAGSFVRNDGSAVLFRGTGLGVNPLASVQDGAANISFGSVGLAGSGAAGTTTVGIIKGAYGDIVSSGNGSGLVTHDSTYGVRLLNTSTEYTAAIADGQTRLDNVRYVRASGGASQDITLTSATTTINSLSFDISGTGTNSGVKISGGAGTTLKLSSGVIFSRNTVTTANSDGSDATVIDVPTLDLNGQEGVFLVSTTTYNQGNTNAPLRINSVITNDDGKGVTIGALGSSSGSVVFSGADPHTYTGVTTLNSGILKLDRGSGKDGIPGDLVMNGGSLIKNTNSIPDGATVTINGGNFYMDSTYSSGNNGHQETVKNLTMNGGSFTNHGRNAALTVTNDVLLTASQLGMNAGGDITVGGNTTLSGGILVARENSQDSAGLTALNTLTIVNKAAGAYTPLVVNSSGSYTGALLTLKGDVTFTGNTTNSNTTTITSSDLALANQGLIALNGVRTFNIGNGAAVNDLTIVPAIADDTAHAAIGGLIKTGLGTLVLNGANSYTGATSVSQGKLVVNGSLASAVTVDSGGTLAGSFTTPVALTVKGGGTLAPGNSPGTAVTGNLTLESAANYAVDLNGTVAGSGYDQTIVTGSVDITGANLVASLGYAPTLGDKLFIVTNDLSDAVAGTFAGLGQNAQFNLTYASTAYRFQISYTGDSVSGDLAGGNDVVLTNVAIPEPATMTMLLGMGGSLLALRRRRVA